MPPKPTKKRTGRDGGSESDTDAEQNRTVVGSSSSPNITMSEEMLQTLVTNITRNQAEANRFLIESLLANKDEPCTSSPRIPDTRDTARWLGNFAKCTARFDGSSKNAEELEAFIDAIEVYRDCTNISDEHALRGLPMLLVGEAAVWWQGVKSSIASWSDALQRLRGMYGVPRPGYKIFREIFGTEQNSERADVFISKVRALITKLPYDVPEVMMLDIVYGLLDRRIRKRVSRDAVHELDQLIAKARLVEESLAEVSASSHCNVNNNPPVAAQERSSTSINPTINLVDTRKSSSKQSDVKRWSDSHTSNVENTDSVSDRQRRVRPKCTYCKFFGHTIEECRNKGNKKEGKVIDLSHKSSDSTELRCYGCGQLGVVRSKCSICKDASTTSKSDFCSAQIGGSDDPLPLVEIKVVNRKGVAILDTGATHSIAGPMLYDLLRKAGVVFRKTLRTIGLADGSQQVGSVLECDTDVILENHVIPTTFIVLPDAQTRTLLGRDFIIRASILLDLPQSSWCFNDEPERWHPFITKFVLPTGGQMKLMKVEAINLVPRDDVGTKAKLGSAPILRQVDESLKTSSSGYCLGAVLMQGEGPKDVRGNRLKDPDVRKIVEKLKATDEPFRGRDWSGRGFIMSDGVLSMPYRVKEAACSTTHVLKKVSSGEMLGRYHVSQLTPFVGDVLPAPVNEKHRRGRHKRFLLLTQTRDRMSRSEGEDVTRPFYNVCERALMRGNEEHTPSPALPR